jgi:hypothetical protein
MLKAKAGDKIRIRSRKNDIGILVKDSENTFRIDWGNYFSSSFSLDCLSETMWEIIPQNKIIKPYPIVKWCKENYENKV